MDVVSIIVPVYNVENFLERCLTSIINQTYTELEIILVDDGSQDESSKICEDFKNKDSRICVIHKKNDGLSEARNSGLKKATGRFITFVDSDDWLELDYVKVLIEEQKKHEADIVISNHQIDYSYQSQPIKNRKHKTKLYDTESALEILFSKQPLPFVVSWGKLYKRELFTNELFPAHRFHEDEATSYKFFYKSKKILYTNQRLYHYFKHNQSITAKPHHDDALNAIEERLNFLQERNQHYFFMLSLPTKCWILLSLCNYQKKLGLDCSKNLDLFKQSVKIYQSNRPRKTFHLLFLSLFAAFPELYFLYKRQ